MEIVEAGKERNEDVVSVWNAVWPDLPMDIEELEHDQATLPAHEQTRYWLASKDGEAVGLGELGHVGGSYHPRHWAMSVAVLPAHRDQGIGDRLYQQVCCGIGPDPAWTINTFCREDDLVSHVFLCGRGYEEVKRDFLSELDLRCFDLPSLEEIEAGPLPDGVRLVAMQEVDSPEIRRSLHLLFEQVRQDIPRTFPPVPMSFEEFLQKVVDAPYFILDGTHVALMDGEVVGFTWEFKGATPGRLDQGLTGVRRDLRGKGLASALKAKAMRWAIQAGYDYVRTDNDTRNAPMLAVNDRLGFKRLPGTIVMQWRNPDGEV